MATTNHFGYLLSGARAQSQARTGSDRLEMLAKTASRDLLQGGVSLNDSITKIAEENDLNQDQIERVCEMANMNTHQAMWPGAQEKEKVAFDLADAKKIGKKKPMTHTQPKKSNPVGAGPVPRGIESDYSGPPRPVVGGSSLFELMGADPSTSHNGLTEIPERKRLTIIMIKKAEERRDLRDESIVTQMRLETAEKLAFTAVKQAVLGGASFRDLYVMAAQSGFAKEASELFPAFQERLIADTHGSVRNRLTKTAIQKAPEELISGDLDGVTVTNGAHPVVVSLDTVNKLTGEMFHHLTGLVRIDDELKIHGQKLQDLS